MIGQQDVRRAIARPRTVDPDRLRVVLDFSLSRATPQGNEVDRGRDRGVERCGPHPRDVRELRSRRGPLLPRDEDRLRRGRSTRPGPSLELPRGSPLEPRLLRRPARTGRLGGRTGRGPRWERGAGPHLRRRAHWLLRSDPNVTNKKFAGNVTRSYRTRHPMRITDEVQTWEGHHPEALQGMLDNIARLRSQGLDVIED
jgi:hypothetical protein